jgi:SET domain-containing protein
MKLIVQRNPQRGRGVYAKAPIQQGEMIEICHLLVFKYAELSPSLEAYVYHFDRHQVALALGLGSLYNHSDTPNAFYYFNKKQKLLYLEASRNIPAGAEITIDYGYTDQDRLRFGIT